MANITLGEWDDHLGRLKLEVEKRWPDFTALVRDNALTLDSGKAIGGDLALRGDLKHGPWLQPHIQGNSNGGRGSAAFIVEAARLTSALAAALCFLETEVDSLMVWPTDAPCDRCKGTGKDLRQQTCEVCKGEKVRRDP